MIVSIVGSPNIGNLLEDFCRTALLAKEAGAKVIEANFSCPNVSSCEGEIATDPEMIERLTSQIVKAINPIPLIIKVGCYPSSSLMRQCLIAAAKGGAQAISGINTIRAKILNHEGSPALSPTRLHSGICGHAIRHEALEFVHSAATIIKNERLPLTLIGVGGITKAEHFSLFFNRGADFAMSATGMMWNPFLAHEYHQKQQGDV